MSLWVLEENDWWFPFRNEMDGDIVAVGGDLKWERVIKGFERSCFPLYGADEEIKWWSPEQRAVFLPHLYPDQNRTLHRLRAKGISFVWDDNFEVVIQHCSRKDQVQDPWLHKDVIEMYKTLFQQGFAHSVSVYQDGELIGGLFGVGLGRVFFGLSMFHLKSNGSKWALLYLIQFLKEKKWKLLDAQVMTPFLAKMGAMSVHRELFLDKMRKMYAFRTPRGNWGKVGTWKNKDPFPKQGEIPSRF
jgi:leucyl/phenylalanyl-tRNA--protein transferase